MRLGRMQKQPAEKVDFDVDFSDWLRACGDTAQSLTVEAEPGITVGAHDIDATSGIGRVWVLNGTDGESYKITVNLLTAGGRLKQTEVIVKVKNT